MHGHGGNDAVEKYQESIDVLLMDLCCKMNEVLEQNKVEDKERCLQGAC